MAVIAEKYTDMRSVSLTPSQGEALDRQAKVEERKVGSLIRRAICQYLVSVGQLSDYRVDPDEDCPEDSVV